MGPSQERIALQLGTAFDLSLQDAAAVLKEIAKAIRGAAPVKGKLVEMQAALLEIVESLADGDSVAMDRVVERLPYDKRMAAAYVQLACRGWLEQAQTDAAKGLRREASLWVEVDRAQHPENELPTAEPPPPPLPDRLRRAVEQEAAQAARHAAQQAQVAARRSLDAARRPAQQPTERRTQVSPTVIPRSKPSAPPPASAPSGPWYSRILRRAWPGGDTPASAFQPRSNPFGLPGVAPDSDAALRRMRQIEGGPIIMNDPGASPAIGAMVATATATDRQADEYRVWFGTNRKAIEGDAGTSFSADRGKKVTYGYCDVYVPKSHKIGELGSDSFMKRLVKRTDDRLKLSRTCPLPTDSFWLQVKYQLETVPLDRRHAIVFIHGYNVSFNAAALRAAQIGCDLNLEGAMAFFSWPSKGDFESYKADEASIDGSEQAIADFLVGFADQTGATGVHVIAHSMGNRAVLRAVDRIARDAQQRTGIPFANFILAAPDVDADLFLNLSAAYKSVAKRTTLYVSERDRALALSSWISDHPRAGYAPPVTICDGIDTVSVTNIDLTVLGHSYFGAAREVLSDMHGLIFKNEAPDNRYGLKPEFIGDKRYWVVRA